MNIQTKNLPKNQVELTISLTTDEVRPFLDRATIKLSSLASVHGFRPGHAPFEVLKNAIGEQKIYENAFELAVQETMPKAIEQEKLDWVGHPSVSVSKIASGNPIEYVVTLALRPEVKLGDVHSLGVKKKEATVTDEDVSSVLTTLQRMRQKETRVQRSAQKGDRVDVDFHLFVDKVPIEGGHGHGHPIVIGDQGFVPGFEDHLIGLSENEKKEFELTFPKDYFQKNIAGKTATVKCEVKAIYALEREIIDDAFSKKIGKFENVGALRDHLKDNIRQERDIEATRAWEQELVNALIERSTIGEIPDLLIQEELEAMMGEMKSDLERRGMKLEDYLAHLKKTEEELRNAFRSQAERRIKAALATGALAEAEHLEVGDEEIEAEVGRIRDHYLESDGKPEGAKMFDQPAYRRHLRNLLLNQKVMEFIKKANG